MFSQFYVYDYFFNFNDSPGNKVPWYFIRKDFVQCIMLSLGLIPTIFCAYLCFVKKREEFLAVTLLGYIWYFPSFGKLIVIIIKTNNIFSKTDATTEWNTFMSYHNDTLINYGFYTIIAVSLLVSILIGLRNYKKFGKTEVIT